MKDLKRQQDELNQRLDDEIEHGKRVEQGLKDNLVIGRHISRPEGTSDAPSSAQHNIEQHQAEVNDTTRSPDIATDTFSATPDLPGTANTNSNTATTQNPDNDLPDPQDAQPR